MLRERLRETEPVEIETRAEFFVRLRRAVKWLNHNKADTMQEMCTNQKKRADEVLDLEGALNSF